MSSRLVTTPWFTKNFAGGWLGTGASSGGTRAEGIAVDASGNVYVSTFGFPESGASSDPGRIVVFDSHGKLLRQLIVSGASPHLLGRRTLRRRRPEGQALP